MALREVFHHLTAATVFEKIALIDDLMNRLRGRRPRIGVAALNPHASFCFSSRRRHTRCLSDGSSDVCSSDLGSEVVACGTDGMVHAYRGDGTLLWASAA